MTISELVQVPAADLIIDKNVRRTVDVDKSFISSIRNHGILQPPVGWKDDAGKVHITMGQRRTIAAQKIGLDTVPVVLMTQQDAEQARIVAQLAENEQRSSLNASDTAAAYAQLQFEYGVTPEQIARKTNSPKAKVDTALAVATSAAASNAAMTLTLDQAALFTEFEGDEDAIERLNVAAAENPAQLEHAAARIREYRLDRAVIERMQAVIVDLGGRVVADHDEFEEAGAEYITRLWRTDDPAQKQIKPDDLRGYSGVVGYVRPGWNREGDDRGFQIFWGITNPSDKGLSGHSIGGHTSRTKTEEEKAAARLKRQAKADMVAATVVRRTWLRDHLLAPTTTRPQKLEESMLRWVASELWHTPGTLRPSNGLDTSLALNELLGDHFTEYTMSDTRDPATGHYIFAPVRVAMDLIEGRDPLRIALAAAIAQTESVVGNPKAEGFGQDPRAGVYLRQLGEWGYTLSDVEQAIVDAYQAKVEAQVQD